MLRIVCWILVILLFSGVGTPFGIVAVPTVNAAPSPTEEDDCVETVQIQVTLNRQRHEKTRKVHRVLAGRTGIDGRAPRHNNAVTRSVTTVFLEAINSPILC
jgi:hypothetical protein